MEYNDSIFDIDKHSGSGLNLLESRNVFLWFSDMTKKYISEYLKLTRYWEIELCDFDDDIVLIFSFVNKYPHYNIDDNGGMIKIYFQINFTIGGFLKNEKYGNVDIEFFKKTKQYSNLIFTMEFEDNYPPSFMSLNQGEVNFDSPETWNNIRDFLKLNL